MHEYITLIHLMPRELHRFIPMVCDINFGYVLNVETRRNFMLFVYCEKIIYILSDLSFSNMWLYLIMFNAQQN